MINEKLFKAVETGKPCRKTSFLSLRACEAIQKSQTVSELQKT